jgi:hypothetical protein
MAALLMAALAQEGSAIETAPLPSVEEVQFETLIGDFDGDGIEDLAAAHQTESGVQMTLHLSSRGEPLVHDLGEASLEGLSWSVVEEAEPLCAEADPALCPAKIDMIEVVPPGGEPFLLAWDGDALETLFPDA